MTIPNINCHTEGAFVFAMTLELARHGLSAEAALALAQKTFAEYMESLGLPFGHPTVDWSPDAAAEVARFMEIDHWERIA